MWNELIKFTQPAKTQSIPQHGGRNNTAQQEEERPCEPAWFLRTHKSFLEAWTQMWREEERRGNTGGGSPRGLGSQDWERFTRCDSATLSETNAIFEEKQFIPEHELAHADNPQPLVRSHCHLLITLIWCHVAFTLHQTQQAVKQTKQSYSLNNSTE